uniref:Putative secreted protein n=1 Tax=Ixodes ricinus TaxID=34613 RepID=V5HCX2_IXORI
MVFKKVALLCVVLCSAMARIRHDETGKCPPLDTDWEDKLDELFSALPTDFPHAILPEVSQDLDTYLGLKLGNASFSGLHRLKPDRPYETFCRDSERVIQFSLRAPEFLELSIPWALRSGINGSIIATAHLSRIEGQIHVTKTEGVSKWVFESLEMVRLEPPYIAVDPWGSIYGVGSVANVVMRWIDDMNRGMIRLIWQVVLKRVISHFLEDRARQVGIPLE